MKRIIFILAVFISISNLANAQRSQEAFSMKIRTVSEVRANNLVKKLSQEIVLSPEQEEDLFDVVRTYLDELQRAQEREKIDEITAILKSQRDKKAKKILTKEEYYNKFEEYVNELQMVQGVGYGRK